MDRHATLEPPVGALFPDAVERARIDGLLGAELSAAMARVAMGPVVPTLDMAAFRNDLGAFDFEEPRALEDLLQWTLERLEHGIVQMNHRRYFGLFNPGPNYPSQCADRIASVFNPQLASSASSPVPVAIERRMIQVVAQRAGLAEGAAGHFATGGSEANFTALICALTQASPRFAMDGVRAFAGQPVFYASHDCHIAWLKVAHQAGVGRSALRLVPTDGQGRMDAHALADLIALDRSFGAVPVMVVATAGTTGAGMVDPLPECADVAARAGLWLHVDAAWGGAALASPRLRGALVGIERADSITIDAHKWFATTMGCAMFLTRHGQMLSEAFHASAAFMPSSVAGVDPYLNSVQWSRRFIGLRLFLSLATAGWPGLAAHVERSVQVVALVRSRLVAEGWSIVNDSPLAVLNAVPPARLGDVRALVRRVVDSGKAWVAPAIYEGMDVVRICATHGETSADDVDELIGALNRPAWESS